MSHKVRKGTCVAPTTCPPDLKERSIGEHRYTSSRRQKQIRASGNPPLLIWCDQHAFGAMSRNVGHHSGPCPETGSAGRSRMCAAFKNAVRTFATAMRYDASRPVRDRGRFTNPDQAEFSAKDDWRETAETPRRWGCKAFGRPLLRQQVHQRAADAAGAQDGGSAARQFFEHRRHRSRGFAAARRGSACSCRRRR